LRQGQKNAKGGKMYVDYKIKEYSEEVFKLLDKGAHICLCALRGMMPEIQHT
jgi:ferredoxin--NADP+ reductase